MTAVLTAEALVVERAGHRVLDGVSCTLTAGSITVIVGANGAGKSTLVGALAGLLPLGGGRVIRPPGSRPPGVVFDRGGLVSGLTVAEMVALPLVRARVAAARVDERLAWAVSRFDLVGVEHHPAERLTRGQAVRVQLARAALMEPAVLLCDAPLDQLAPDVAAEIGRLLARAAGAGTAVLITTNIPERLSGLTASVWRLEQGRLAPAGR